MQELVNLASNWTNSKCFWRSGAPSPWGVDICLCVFQASPGHQGTCLQRCWEKIPTASRWTCGPAVRSRAASAVDSLKWGSSARAEAYRWFHGPGAANERPSLVLIKETTSSSKNIQRQRQTCWCNHMFILWFVISGRWYRIFLHAEFILISVQLLTLTSAESLILKITALFGFLYICKSSKAFCGSVASHYLQCIRWTGWRN